MPTDDLATLLTRVLTHAPGEDAAGEASETDTRILDAALVEIGAHGARGATIDAIADAAGVGRVTVFRRFGSKERLVQALGLRELQRFLGAVQDAAAEVADPADRIADAFLACVRLSEEHPLISRLVRQEPAGAFAQLTSGTPSAVDLGTAFVAAQLAAMQAETGRRAGDPGEIAELLVRIALGYVLVPSALLDVRDMAAVRAFAHRALVPIALGRD